MEREGVAVRQTAVGDRYVLEEMRAGGYSLGGEQSGHVIFLDHGTTGDGVLTGLMLAARMAETGRSIADLGAVMTRLPQVLVNVKGVDKGRVESDGGCSRRCAGGAGARRPRPGAAAQVGHRAARAGDGRGGRGRSGRSSRRPPRRRRPGAPRTREPPLAWTRPLGRRPRRERWGYWRLAVVLHEEPVCRSMKHRGLVHHRRHRQGRPGRPREERRRCGRPAAGPSR